MLILAGDLDVALTEVTRGLQTGAIAIEQSGWNSSDPAESLTIAVINRGVPGYAVDTDGGLNLSLMRSSTGWPAGVWIDPPARTAPDGSSFQQQHWSHDFEYAIAAGAGDWRQARIVERASAVSQRLVAALACGAPAAGEFLKLDPADGVAVAALKAAGNELANGRRPTDQVGEFTLRLFEAHGRACQVGVTCAFSVLDVQRTNILEEPQGNIDHSESGFTATLDAAETGTWRVRVAATPARRIATPPAASVFSPYWLHNLGAAPSGNHPIAVHLAPQATVAGNVWSIGATVAATGARLFDAALEWSSPSGHSITARSVSVLLDGDGWDTVSCDVNPRSADGGPVVVCVRVHNPDIDTYDIGFYDPASGKRLTAQKLGAVTTEWDRAQLRLVAGRPSRLSLRVATGLATEIDGEVLLLGPWGTWEWTQEWRRPCRVPTVGSNEVVFTLRPPAAADWQQTWLMAKIVGAGVRAYSPALPVLLESA